MSTTYTITDEYTDNRADRIPGTEVAETLRPWFTLKDGSIMAEIDEQIDTLGAQLARGDYAHGRLTAEGLALVVERHDG